MADLRGVAPDSLEAARGSGPWMLIMLAALSGLTIPAGLVLAGPLASNGWPPRLLVFLAAGGVLVGWMVRGAAGRAPASPALIGTFLLLGACLVAYFATGMRAASPEETAGALRAVLAIVPVAIVAAGIAQTATERQVNVLLQVLVVGAAVSALVALAQYVKPFDFASLIQMPGTVAREAGGMGSRGGFTRVNGAAEHPIEFSVITGAVLPLAIHAARFASDGLRRLVHWVVVGVFALAVPMAVSRSGVVVVAVALLVYGVALNGRQRLTLLVVVVAGGALLRAVIPGLLGTVTSIFTSAATDPSVSGRTDDYVIIGQLFRHSPLLGMGLGTFRPEVYFFLDNAYLLAAVEGGLLLVSAVVVFFLLGVAAARGAALRAPDDEHLSRSQALAASIAAIGLAAFFFDLFSFAQVTLLCFLLVGMAGASWRLSLQSGRALPTPLERIRGVPADRFVATSAGTRGASADGQRRPVRVPDVA